MSLRVAVGRRSESQAVRAGEQPVVGNALSRGSPLPWLLGAVAFGVIVLVSGLIWAATRTDPLPSGVPVEVVGKYQVRLYDWPDRRELSFWKTYRSLLGDPIWEEQTYRGQPHCVGFENYILCVSSAARDAHLDWQFVPLPLGWESLKAIHQPIEKDAVVAPIVEHFFETLAQDVQAAGRGDLVTKEDIARFWFGPVLRHPLCVGNVHAEPRTCNQVFERQVVVFPEGSQDPSSVKLWPQPLGKRAERP